MSKTCTNCRLHVDEWNKTCGGCGFHLVLEPDEARRARYLRGPALGALLFTQGWMFGARLYLLAILSFIPVIGIPVLIIGLLFGRRLSWKHGGWDSWEAFQTRMRFLEYLGFAWILLLLGSYLYFRA